jgi:glycosyltransferase involved in cell wall biosynthesis
LPKTGVKVVVIMSELTIVIPAFNEEDSLVSYVPELIEFCEKEDFRLIIVNDGSTDSTEKILNEFGEVNCFSAIHHKVNKGYGGAIKSGIRNVQTRYAITIDADGQHDLADVISLLESMKKTGADMIVGSRVAHKDASFYRSIGKRLIRWFAKLLMPIHIEDINSGIKIYETDLAKRYIKLCPDHMAFSDIITMVFISKKNLVLEQPVNIKPRKAGVSTINTLTALETVEEILNIVILFNPMRVFLPIAIFGVTLAFVWAVPIILKGRGVSTGALLSFVSGVLFFCLGLLAEQLSQIRKNSVDE